MRDSVAMRLQSADIATVLGDTDSSPVVPRSLLRDIVFVRLLVGILKGHYPRGQRLRLDAIAADMRVSRTPVREALMPLENLRLVAVHRYVGVVIADWTIGQMFERVIIARGMLADTAPNSAESLEFGSDGIQGCASEGGVLMLLAAWCLRCCARPVSADWVEAQRHVLDVFFAADVAAVHGIDVRVGRHERLAVLTDARAAAARGDLTEVLANIRVHADRLVAVAAQIEPRSSRYS